MKKALLYLLCGIVAVALGDVACGDEPSPLVLFTAMTGKPGAKEAAEYFDAAQKAGFSQVLIYPRSGLEHDYMGEEWLSFVGDCLKEAKTRGMKAWLYEEEIASIAAKHRMAKFPNLALTRERLSRKAKAEPKFRFYTLYGRVVDEETIRCAWECVWKKDKALGVDGQTFEAIERGEGGVEGFLASIQRELKAKTYRASPGRTGLANAAVRIAVSGL